MEGRARSQRQKQDTTLENIQPHERRVAVCRPLDWPHRKLVCRGEDSRAATVLRAAETRPLVVSVKSPAQRSLFEDHSLTWTAETRRVV